MPNTVHVVICCYLLKYFQGMWENVPTDDGLDDQRKKLVESTYKPNNMRKLSFVRILQHVAAAGKIRLCILTLFLTLLKKHQPTINYQKLPKQGRTLLRLDEKDKARLAEQVITAKEGKAEVGTYVHFGLEDAILGQSPGACTF